jgi:EAL domain-containing protein (putative c-di-GMP-specific phosphodiesterase class I)
MGVLMPADFIDIIEKRGFIYKLDRCMWEQAARQLSIWQEKGIEDLSISVNVSTKDFYFTDLYRTFTRLVEKYNIIPQRLKIEITETLFMDDVKEHMDTIRRMKEYGFCIELDDFGSGYSSLNMLKDIDADIIKIDMAFLEETDNIKRSHTIIRSIINMAKDLGMDVITEGVRSKEHVNFLTDAGCDIFQGYYYSKPIIVDEFEKKYLNNR